MDGRFEQVDSRFNHVDSELRDIKLKINELIDVSGESGLQGKKVIKFPGADSDVEEM